MTALDVFTVVAVLVGGLALFLVGMDTMSESLTAMTGGVLNRVIDRITKNRFFAFLFGAGLTAVVQSSSAITVLSVGLVNSGILELGKAAGLIIGANLGTTATAWILSMNAVGGESLILTLIKPSSFTPFLALVGVFMKMFCRSEKKKNTGSVLLGFSVMMIGMTLMSQAVSTLREIPAIRNMLVSFSNPILGFLFACVFAMLIQSSDAVIGILQAFALSMGITFGTAIPLICGAQVGTCVTALLSSLGASNNGKRTALVNLYYNLLKTIPFLLVFYLLHHLIGFSFLTQNVGGIGIPVVHTLVNIVGSVVWLPLSGVLVSLASRTIPLSEREKQEQANTLTILDKGLLKSPSFAIEQARKAVNLLAQTVEESFLSVIDINQDRQKLLLLSERTEKYREQIENYLTAISSQEIGKKQRAGVKLLSSANIAFGRMGLLAEQIFDFAEKIGTEEEKLTPEDRKEALVLGEAIYEIMQLTIDGFAGRKKSLSQTVQYYREEIMNLGNLIKGRYVRRAHEEGRERSQITLFTDFCYTEEKLIDYCDMIAEASIRYDKEMGMYSRPAPDDSMREQIHMLFQDKYEALEKKPEG